MILYIVRGLPGSGKSTLARKIVSSEFIRETDMYFIEPHDETYHFDPKLLPNAHKWCQEEIRKLLQAQHEEVCVANTFTMRWEYQPYLDMATEYGEVLKKSNLPKRFQRRE